MENEYLCGLDVFKAEAKNLLNDLTENRLTVTLSGPIDTTGRRLRIVEFKNPSWYSSLFLKHHNGFKGKRSRSLIRRKSVQIALRNIAEGNFKNTLTFYELIELIKDRVFNGYEEQGIFIPPMVQIDDLKEFYELVIEG